MAALLATCATTLRAQTIVDIAAGDPDFSTLVTALQATGLDAALQEPGPFTVFAPNNAAFDALPPGALDDLLADPDALAQVLLYHVVPGALLSGDLVAGSLVTLQGAAATISLTGGVFIDAASVIAPDVEASNGIIHVIDEVLLPADGFVANEVSFKRIGSEFTIVWPALYLGLSPTLEFTDDLTSDEWTPVTSGIVTADDIQKTTIPLEGTIGYYRVAFQ